MATASDVLKRLEALKLRREVAARAHAVAESQYAQAQALATKAEEELKALGVDPATAEETLRTMLDELEKATQNQEEEIAQRLKEYETIDAEFRKLS